MIGNLVLFDFDGTLTRHDSFTGFIRYTRGLIGLVRVLLLSAPAILLWKSGRRSALSAKLKMFSTAFKGMPMSDFQAKGAEYANKIDRMLRPDVYAKLQEATGRGDTVAIVSASLSSWICPWAVRNGVDRVIATEPQVDATGHLTGKFATPNCTGEEKVKRLLDAFPQLADRAATHITAYGDSAGDDAMLAFADEPHRIHHKRFR